MSPPTRDQAWSLLTRHTRGESLLNHARAVEAAMRAQAERTGADIEMFGLAGLLHDLDYEAHPSPEEHPRVGVAVLKEAGYPDEILQAVLSHAPHTGVPRATPMDRALFAVDELCGFLVACALVQPGRTLAEVRVPSVLKKLKDRHFARGVDRDHIRQGAAEMGVELPEHIEFVLESLRRIAPDLGLG